MSDPGLLSIDHRSNNRIFYFSAKFTPFLHFENNLLVKTF